jgi:hypothetical protein
MPHDSGEDAMIVTPASMVARSALPVGAHDGSAA